jgi:hypothetical protein
MSFTVYVWWNDFLGFHGPPVRGASFDSVTYGAKGTPPTFTPLRATPVGTAGNGFFVERGVAAGDVRCVGYHPDTRERRESIFSIANGATREIVV